MLKLWRTVTFDQSTIADNTATNDGGGILNLVGNISVQVGGGDAASRVTLTRTSITDNNASSGGGIYNEDSAPLTDCHIAGNHAIFGGGIYHDSSNIFMRKDYGGLEFSGTTFASNSALRGSRLRQWLCGNSQLPVYGQFRFAWCGGLQRSWHDDSECLHVYGQRHCQWAGGVQLPRSRHV